jgi:hypothetical protein
MLSKILPIMAFACLAMPAADKGRLRVGAARVDITPPADAALPMSGYANRTHGFEGIHDHIYARAIVLSDGAATAALVSWELIGVPNPAWADVSARIAKECGIPVDHLLLAAVHDHSAPSPAGIYGNASPKSAEYTERLKQATVEAVRQAKAKLQPARVGYGAGRAYVNVNRRELTPDRGWWLGFNPEGVSDKTLAVLRFETDAGVPIAFLINYPVHAVVMGPENYQISGDIAGATSRYVEQYYARTLSDPPRSDAGYLLRPRPGQAPADVVALWTSGAAGDQNPVSLASKDFTMVDALGKILGEESVRVANAIAAAPDVRLYAAQRVVACPGRKVEEGPRPRREYKFQDADPVEIRLSLLLINDIAVTGVSGEVLTPIYLHLKRESPFSRTIMLTHTNGASGYIPDDAGFDQIGYEVTTSHLKPGCAENAIVNGLVDMMSR